MVFTLRCSSSAICRVPCPSPINRNTSSSRSVRFTSGEPWRPSAVDKLLQHRTGQPVAEINLTLQNSTNGHQHFLGCFLLHDVAVRSGAHGPLCVNRLVVHRKNQHRQTPGFHADFLEHVQSIRSAQRNIQHHDIRPQAWRWPGTRNAPLRPLRKLTDRLPGQSEAPDPGERWGGRRPEALVHFFASGAI